MKHTNATTGLRRDTNGAVMLIALFMAMISIGFLYYLVGLGDAILAQERMQDAADATAYSAAVIHARGMNLIALMNILMAALLAILVMLAMLASLFKYAAVVLASVAVWFPPLASGVPPLRTTSKLFAKAEQMSKKPVYKSMKAISKLQGPLKTVIPIIANINAVKLSRQSYGPVVKLGITFPIANSLPILEGKFDTICKHAGVYAGEIVSFPIRAVFKDGPLGDIPGVEFIADLLISGVSESAKAYAEFYCGNGTKPNPPSTSQKVGIPVLDSPNKDRCNSKGSDQNDDACETYEKEVTEATKAYSEKEGKCVGTYAEQCQQLIERARTECHPMRGEPEHSYRWRKVTKRQRFVLIGRPGKYTVEQNPAEEIRETAKVVSKKVSVSNWLANPICNGDMSVWNGEGKDKPLCQTYTIAPDVDEFLNAKTREIYREIEEVTDVLLCQQERTIHAEFVGEAMTEKERKDIKPQAMCNCAELGEEEFQIRSIVAGDSEEYTQEADKRILVATAGKQAESGVISDIVALGGHVAGAQAEYYFDDADADRSEWLWDMKWKARIRRLSFRPAFDCPRKSNCESGARAQEKSGNPKMETFKKLLGEGINSLIVH